MASWTRCAKCRYIRHVNDDGRSRRDTCPMCGAVYDKSEAESVRLERRRRLRSHRHLLDRKCPRCDEIVSSFAAWCPRCKGPIRHRGRTAAIAAAACLIVGVVVWTNTVNQRMISPFPGVSNARFKYCVELSATWSQSIKTNGHASPQTLSAQNDWHAKCSRKALREVASQNDVRLPNSAEGWLVATNY